LALVNRRAVILVYYYFDSDC